jgi:NAD-dependent deacetylase sirtuin 4
MLTPTGYSELLALCRAATPRLLVITGAGLSTESGIPDYRSPAGSYSKGHKPVQHDDFIGNVAARKRYWSRSLRGWAPFSNAQPNAGHQALAKLDHAQQLLHIITQNVDGLHQRAGATGVSELHGSAHAVRCLDCGSTYSRQHVQGQLAALNYWWLRKTREEQQNAELRADGDAELALLPDDEPSFRIPPCAACGGVLKTDVTFFGDSLPVATKARSLELAQEASGVLVAGTSLSVLSAFRLVETAAANGAPIAVVNLGETRLEKAGIPHLKVEAPCGATLSRLADDLLDEIVQP